jgi:hypothetical protein
MVQVKGTSIAGRRQYVLKHHGEDKLHSVMAQLKDREGAKRIEASVLKSAWYPFSLLIDMTETIDRVVGKGDGKLYRAMAGQTAEDDLSTVYKVFFKFLQPMYIVQKAAQLWSAYYTSGKMIATEIQPGTIEFEIVDFESPHWAHCESVLGWAERSIQLTGVKGVKAEHLECRAKGAKRCRMRVSWNPK